VDYQYRNILKEPPNIEELEELASLGGMEVSELLNPKSKAFKNTGADLEKITSQEAGNIIFENSRAMHRPLFTDGKALVVGFKPEEMEKLL